MKVMRTSPIPIISWPWYVDDSTLKCKSHEADQILDHLNSQEPGIIVFTKEEEQQGNLAVLDLKNMVNRRTKKVEFTVNYKTTHTNINVKAKSNHPDNMKRAIMKGFSERARALCDDEYLEDEIKNIEDTFVANGFDRDTVREYMKEQETEERTEDEEEIRGIVVVPYLKGFSEKFKRIAKKHGFRVAHKPGTKIKTSRKLSQEPLGKKQTNVTYRIPCECEKYVYTGETSRMFETREYEHQMKVRSTHQDIRDGKIESAESRMNSGDGGVSRHSIECSQNIDWENCSITAVERNSKERKIRESIESERERNFGRTVLNQYEQIPHWKAVLEKFFNSEVDRGGRR